MEDVWLGSMLHRFPLSKPVRYVSLLGDRVGQLYVDAWDFRIARSVTRHLTFFDMPRVTSALSDGSYFLPLLSFCAGRADTRHYEAT